MQIKCIKSRIKINFCSLCFKMSGTRGKIFFNYDFFLFVCLNSDTHDENGKSKSSFVSIHKTYWLDFAISSSKGRKYFLNYFIEILRRCYISTIGNLQDISLAVRYMFDLAFMVSLSFRDIKKCLNLSSLVPNINVIFVNILQLFLSRSFFLPMINSNQKIFEKLLEQCLTNFFFLTTH